MPGLLAQIATTSLPHQLLLHPTPTHCKATVDGIVQRVVEATAGGAARLLVAQKLQPGSSSSNTSRFKTRQVAGNPIMHPCSSQTVPTVHKHGLGARCHYQAPQRPSSNSSSIPCPHHQAGGSSSNCRLRP
jgi:hypothetical protein